MFTYNFTYELKSLLRSKWLLLLAAILLIVMIFAGYNGDQKVNNRLNEIEKTTSISKTKDSDLLAQLKAIENGTSKQKGSRSVSNPMTVGLNYPRTLILPPSPFTFISIGQSDLFEHITQSKIYGDNFANTYTELSSPIQLLFGSFDIAFVIIYILPLIIIAFSYNVLSNEKEYGTIKLLASQPISLFTWLMQKIGLRFFWFTMITISILLITLIINGFDFTNNFGGLLKMLLLVVSYILFWFAIAFTVNIAIGNSAKNAVLCTWM